MRSIDHYIDHIKDSIMFKKLVIASALALAASASFAQTAPGVYAGLDVGSSKADDYDDRETSFGGFVGYNFNENFALEGGYRSLYDADNVEATQTALSVIGTLPLSNGFNVFGRLGYNRLAVEAKFAGVTFKDHESKPLYGIGLGYAFSPTVSGRVELQRPNKEFSNLSVGVAFKF
jgi:hypothetical protein